MRPEAAAMAQDQCSAVSIRNVFVGFSALPSAIDLLSIQGARKQTARLQGQHHEEGEMARQDLPFRVDARADSLREAENDAARKCAPEASEATDDHGLEGIKQPPGSDGGVEICA